MKITNIVTFLILFVSFSCNTSANISSNAKNILNKLSIQAFIENHPDAVKSNNKDVSSQNDILRRVDNNNTLEEYKNKEIENVHSSSSYLKAQQNAFQNIQKYSFKNMIMNNMQMPYLESHMQQEHNKGFSILMNLENNSKDNLNSTLTDEVQENIILIPEGSFSQTRSESENEVVTLNYYGKDRFYDKFSSTEIPENNVLKNIFAITRYSVDCKNSGLQGYHLFVENGGKQMGIEYKCGKKLDFKGKIIKKKSLQAISIEYNKIYDSLMAITKRSLNLECDQGSILVGFQYEKRNNNQLGVTMKCAQVPIQGECQKLKINAMNNLKVESYALYELSKFKVKVPKDDVYLRRAYAFNIRNGAAVEQMLYEIEYCKIQLPKPDDKVKNSENTKNSKKEENKKNLKNQIQPNQNNNKAISQSSKNKKSIIDLKKNENTIKTDVLNRSPNVSIRSKDKKSTANIYADISKVDQNKSKVNIIMNEKSANKKVSKELYHRATKSASIKTNIDYQETRPNNSLKVQDSSNKTNANSIYKQNKPKIPDEKHFPIANDANIPYAQSKPETKNMTNLFMISSNSNKPITSGIEYNNNIPPNAIINEKADDNTNKKNNSQGSLNSSEPLLQEKLKKEGAYKEEKHMDIKLDRDDFCNFHCVQNDLNINKEAKNCFFKNRVVPCYSCTAKKTPNDSLQITEEKTNICTHFCNNIEMQVKCRFFGFINFDMKQYDTSMLRKYGLNTHLIKTKKFRKARWF